MKTYSVYYNAEQDNYKVVEGRINEWGYKFQFEAEEGGKWVDEIIESVYFDGEDDKLLSMSEDELLKWCQNGYNICDEYPQVIVDAKEGKEFAEIYDDDEYYTLQYHSYRYCRIEDGEVKLNYRIHCR